MKWEVDLRSRRTGNSVETIFSGDYETAMEYLNKWYAKHPELNIETLRENYIDGSDGVFADMYETKYPHGVGKWDMFEWYFDEEDLIQANQSTVEDDIFGCVYVASNIDKYVVDIHKEYYNSKNCGFDLEIYLEAEGGGHGEWLGYIDNIRSAKSYKRFKNRAEKLIKQFIEEEEQL